MWFSETTAEDLTPGFCLVVADADMSTYEGVYIYPGRVGVDLANLVGVESIEVDHRFGSYLNSHVHFHVLVTDGVFAAGDDGEAVFHPALDLATADFRAVQTKMRHHGLRWLLRHGHLDDNAVHVLDIFGE